MVSHASSGSSTMRLSASTTGIAIVHGDAGARHERDQDGGEAGDHADPDARHHRSGDADADAGEERGDDERESSRRT